MRKTFVDLLLPHMRSNTNIFLLTADLGYGILDRVKTEFPNRFYNVGAAEQLLIGVACGLADSGKIPICYSITPFLLYRPFELLRTYVNYENIPVKLVGSGRDVDYFHDGISHWAQDDEDILNPLTNISIYKPTKQTLPAIFSKFLYEKNPSYLNLARN